MWLAYLVAGALCILLGLVELLTQLRTRPTFGEGSWPYWLGRVAVDAVAAALAVVALEQLLTLPWESDAVTGIVAGLSAPSLLRQHLTHVGTTPIGVAAGYDFVRNFFDRGIKDAASERDSKWVEERLIPDLIAAGMDPEEIGKRLIRWVNGRDDIAVGDRIDLQATIRATIADGVDNEKKILSLVDLALEQKAFRTLHNLHDTARNNHA